MVEDLSVKPHIDEKAAGGYVRIGELEVTFRESGVFNKLRHHSLVFHSVKGSRIEACGILKFSSFVWFIPKHVQTWNPTGKLEDLSWNRVSRECRYPKMAKKECRYGIP